MPVDRRREKGVPDRDAPAPLVPPMQAVQRTPTAGRRGPGTTDRNLSGVIDSVTDAELVEAFLPALQPMVLFSWFYAAGSMRWRTGGGAAAIILHPIVRRGRLRDRRAFGQVGPR